MRILDLGVLVDGSVGISTESIGQDADKSPNGKDNEKTDDAPEDSLADRLAIIGLVGGHDIADNIADDVYDREGYENLNNNVTDVGKLVRQRVDIGDGLS